MPRFSAQSRRHLGTCRRELKILFGEVIKDVDCTVTQGHRGEEAQNEAYAREKTTKQWPDSKHNQLPSDAADVAPYDAEIRGIDWDDVQGFWMFVGYVRATFKQLQKRGMVSTDVRLRVGGDWDGDFDTDDQQFNDAPHFEIVEF